MVVYFSTATNRRSRGALWSIIAPPFIPVGLRLPAGFKIPHSQRFESADEMAQLLKILEAEWKARTADAWKPHPMFGKMTIKEWGKLLQIHVDYHPKQLAA